MAKTAAQKKADDAAALAEKERLEAEAAEKAAAEAAAEAEAENETETGLVKFKNPTEAVIRVANGSNIVTFQPGEERELPAFLTEACTKALITKV